VLCGELQLLEVRSFEFMAAGFKAGCDGSALQQPSHLLQQRLLAVVRQHSPVNVCAANPAIPVHIQLPLDCVSVAERRRGDSSYRVFLIDPAVGVFCDRGIAECSGEVRVADSRSTICENFAEWRKARSGRLRFRQVSAGEQQRECTTEAVAADENTACAGDGDVLNGPEDLGEDGVEGRLEAGMHFSVAVPAGYETAGEICEPVAEFKFGAAESHNDIVVPATHEDLCIGLI